MKRNYLTENELVSVIVPTYNRASMIEVTLDSIYNQDYRPIELLVIDDGSSDHTKEIIRSWQEKRDEDKIFTTKYVYQQNKGAPVARNIGLELAKGRYLQFLDSDDYLCTNKKFSTQINLLKKENNALCLCDFKYIDQKGSIFKKVNNNHSLSYFIRGFRSASIMCPLLDRNKIKPLITWNINLNRNQDIDYFIKIYSVCNNISYINKYYCAYVHHKNAQISDKYIEGPQYKLIIISILRHIKSNYKYIPAYRLFDLSILLIRLNYWLIIFNFKKK